VTNQSVGDPEPNVEQIVRISVVIFHFTSMTDSSWPQKHSINN